MRKFMLGTAATAALALTMSFTVPASAQVAGSRTAAALNSQSAQNNVIEVRNRRVRRGRHWRGRHWGHRHWRHRRHRHGWHWGPGFGLGLGAGLLFGGLAANAQAQSAIDWCDARYRSYDRASQTYLGYDGYRHPCP